MPKFGELEATIMDLLWSSDRPMLVREVVETIQRDRSSAFTTVQTVLEILHGKGWVAREKDGRAYRYWPSQPREEYTARLLGEAFDTTSDRSSAFSRLLEQMDPAEVAELRAAIDVAKSAEPESSGRTGHHR